MAIKNLVPSIWRRSGIPLRREESPFYAFQREMNRLFDDFFRGLDIPPFGALEERFGGFSPSIDLKEDDKEVSIKAELPGIDEKEIEVR